MRLDVQISQKYPQITRTHAKNLIELGYVSVNGKISNKPSQCVTDNDEITVVEDYSASLGSIKLQKAIEEFNPIINGKVCLDLGAANGGFTEVLLKNGAQKVIALDVGECALPESLKNHPKVIVKDRTNARFIEKKMFDENVDLITGDLSFISLKLILPVAYAVLEKGGYGIFLIKPQFESERKNISKSGVIKDRKIHKKVVEDIKSFAEMLGFCCMGITEAPHPFANKNLEFLIYLCKL